MNGKRDVLFVVGHARFPAETTAKQVYNNFGLGLLLDRGSGKILEVSCTTLPPYGNQFLKELFLGKNIHEDLKTITREIRFRYVCRTRNTILAALNDLLKRLQEHEKRLKEQNE